MNTDILIVGAGIAGVTLARRIAEETNKKIMVVDKRHHIGGYCYDYRNHEGILIHRFGPHIFRTDSKEVYDFLSRFTQWCDYQHKVLAYAEGHFYPMPINLDTVNKYLGTDYSSESVLTYFEKARTNPQKIDNVKDAVESQIGPIFYKAFFEQYTLKQWGEKPENLPAEIIARIPIRSNRDDRYYTVQYQAVPQEGYTVMLQNMLNHPNIKVMLNTDYKEIKDQIKYKKMYYSGLIDEYYDFKFGKLPYRCVNFIVEELEMEQYQSAAVVNYPNNYDYTRITEFKHFYKTKSKNTAIAKEYPSSEGDPSYPIPTKENSELYKKYAALADNNNVEFIGRLGQYKYYSMDQVISDILKMRI